MVKLIVSSIAAFALLAVAQAQATTPTQYPPGDQVPDIKSAQVQAWLKEIDLTGIPNPPSHGQLVAPACDRTPKGACIWMCEICPADDIIDCPLPNHWAITFDDGPTAATPPLLDYLKEQNVKATFFVQGTNLVQNKETLLREFKEGHILASHTWSHRALTALSNEQIVAEVKWTEKAVEDITGVRMKYIRPPFGDIDNRVRQVLKKLGYKVVNWSLDFDTKDYEALDATTRTKASAAFHKKLSDYVKGPKAHGIYSLQHDNTPGNVEFAKVITPYAAELGLKTATLSECQSDPYPYQGTPPPNTNTTNPTTTSGGSKNNTAPSSTSTAAGGKTTSDKPSSASGLTVNAKTATAAMAMVAAAAAYFF
ncbi:chitin deacetylase [Lunasporangiospora selenospora]|uniref:Chitin deacetylase n=1 Tax=Lunasporangiospora selenospora TaxID=979761 RepID=A0A9P6FZG2_9FUNG|nr:chitin deacetylase [Lunasporangiospora selenospora]